MSHLIGEEEEEGSSYVCGPDLGGLDLAGIGAQSAGNWGPHLHLNENPETPDLGDRGWRGETAVSAKALVPPGTQGMEKHPQLTP